MNKNNSSLLQKISKIILLALIAITPMYFVINQGGAKLEFTTPVIVTTILMCLVLVASAFSIFGYDYEFEKNITEKEKMNSLKHYAPEYTKEEKSKLLKKRILWAVPIVTLFIILNFWFLPLFQEYSKTAHCINYGSFTGTHVVMYGVFVGLPLFIFFLSMFSEGKRNFKIIKANQVPLLGEKVFKPTEYTYGLKAKIQPYIFFILMFFILGLSLQGFLWANEIVTDVDPHKNTEKCNNT